MKLLDVVRLRALTADWKAVTGSSWFALRCHRRHSLAAVSRFVCAGQKTFFFLSCWQFAAFQNNFQVLYFLQQRRRQFHLTCRLGPKKKKKKTRGWRQRGQRALIPTLNSSSHIPWILTAVNLDTALIWKIEVVGWESWQRWRCADRFWNEHIHPAVLTVETALEAAPKPVPALSELMHEMWPWLH